jgi:hypothetical protein
MDERIEPVTDLGGKCPPKDKRTRKQIQIDFNAKSWLYILGYLNLNSFREIDNIRI